MLGKNSFCGNDSYWKCDFNLLIGFKFISLNNKPDPMDYFLFPTFNPELKESEGFQASKY